MELSLASLSFRPFPKPRPTSVSTAKSHLLTFKQSRVAFAVRAPIRRAWLNCVQGEPRSAAETEPEKSEKAAEEDDSSGSASGLGNGENPELSSIKEAIRKRKEQEGDLSLSGVAEEIREIEWPVFGRVLGTTGVVLAVIAGSSVVLLTVNAVLAELSDRVFAGKGVQDIFG
ncbi:hypothetical protein ACLOJK_030882 [Asimina triloba]